MPVATPPPSAYTVPTIDISAYLSDPSSPEAQKIVSAVRQACMTIGFFEMTGHGVPRSLQDEVFEGARRFFALPIEEKKKIERKEQAPLGNRGYEIMGTQVLQVGAPPDMKEGFYISADYSPSHPLTQSHPTFMGPNVFPPAALLAPSTFQGPTERYYQRMRELAGVVLSILAAGLPYGPHLFDDFNTEPLAVMRLLHYPPADAVTLGAGAHTDFGAFTLLLQDGNRGLQVRNPESGEWMAIDPNPEAYVVNIGDMLQLWTRGMYKSNLHRVINYSNSERYSVPFFFNGNLSCKLAPFDGEPVEGGIITVEDHMTERFSTTYGAAKAAY